MKKILITLLASVALVFTGCEEIPSREQMETTSVAIGQAAGYVANQTKIDNNARAAVVKVVQTVFAVVPASNQTFVAAWTAPAQDIVDKLSAAGKLDANQSVLAMTAFSAALKGLDYMFTVRYPKARQYEELVSAATTGFEKGFLSTFQPTTAAALAAPSDGTYDKEAYDYLMKEVNK